MKATGYHAVGELLATLGKKKEMLEYIRQPESSVYIQIGQHTFREECDHVLLSIANNLNVEINAIEAELADLGVDLEGWPDELN